MGSELRVDSQPGVGSLFFFTLHMPVYAGQISEQEEQKGVSGYSLERTSKYFWQRIMISMQILRKKFWNYRGKGYQGSEWKNSRGYLRAEPAGKF